MMTLRGNRRREGHYAFTGVNLGLRKKSNGSFKGKNAFVNSECIFKKHTICSLLFI